MIHLNPLVLIYFIIAILALPHILIYMYYVAGNQPKRILLLCQDRNSFSAYDLNVNSDEHVPLHLWHCLDTWRAWGVACRVLLLGP